MSDQVPYRTAEIKTPYLFDAVLYPGRSLGRNDFVLLMAVLLGLSFVMGGYFWSKGAWPITGFYGLEIFVVWWAFRANYIAARDYETVRLTETELIVEEHSNRQGQKKWIFNPLWAQVHIDDPPESDSPLTIMSHGKGVQIGAFLSPQERLEIARSLRNALQTQKTGWRVPGR